jgi:ligand-binding SRPBCC domain-containing protein
MTVPKPLDEVFSVFENPYNLARITPPWLQFRVTSPQKVEMRLGAEIEYRIHWLGFPVEWKTRIPRYDPPLAFVDEALVSPYIFWRHIHTFEPSRAGTLVRDTVDYALPLGPLGALAHKLLVRRQLIAIFTYRQKALDEYWGGGSRIVWPTVRSIESPSLPVGTASPAAHKRA